MNIKIKIATMLVAEFKTWLKEKEISLVELQVFNSNKSAISLYEKLGFKPLRTVYKTNIIL